VLDKLEDEKKKKKGRAKDQETISKKTQRNERRRQTSESMKSWCFSHCKEQDKWKGVVTFSPRLGPHFLVLLCSLSFLPHTCQTLGAKKTFSFGMSCQIRKGKMWVFFLARLYNSMIFHGKE